MKYRTMTVADHAAALKLWQMSAGVNVRSADSYEATERYLLRNPGLSFIAQQDDELVGTIMAGHDGRRGYIQHLAVVAKARGKGVANQLVERCIEALGQAGVAKSHVHVHMGNDNARRFWSKRGWVVRSDVVMFSWIHGDDENS